MKRKEIKENQNQFEIYFRKRKKKEKERKKKQKIIRAVSGRPTIFKALSTLLLRPSAICLFEQVTNLSLKALSTLLMH